MTTRVTGESATAPSPEAIGAVRCERPQTGAEYLESLRDGREVYIYGERVADVTAHPAFRNTARMAARLFDALHDPERADQLLLPTDTGSGGKTHAFFKAPTNLDESIAGRNAIAAWARITYGWMGRAPDYKAAFLATLGANAEFTLPTRTTPDAGIASRRSACPLSTTPSSTRRSIGIGHRTRSPTSAVTWNERPMPA
jgi:4-hydroxyphenylacetate 3-hydroxylase N terminal